MNLEEAIKTAIEYESRVYKTYLDATKQATDEAGKRVFTTLCEEEKGHIDYLRSRLEEWQSSGSINIEALDTAIPSRDAIDDGVAKLRAKVSGEPDRRHDVELELLNRALQVEVETSNFYKEMVRTLDEQGQRLFKRFVEIEEGHQAIVQAEIDCVSGLGFWFDTPEFNLEAG
jgi:rubrerythrin